VSTIKSVLAGAKAKLGAAGIISAGLDAEILLGHLLGVGREHLFLDSGRSIDTGIIARYGGLIERRLLREPVARITGVKEFWSLDFAIDASTLVPRPDSETLVEAALEYIKASEDQNPQILDLGSGSGCLLLALLHEVSGASGLGIDISGAAVKTASDNAISLGLNRRGQFEVADYASFEGDNCYDLIISNPPYIATAHIAGLEKDVAAFDPLIALDGGRDGLDAYRLLARRAGNWLRPGGRIFFEVGSGQSRDVAALLGDVGWGKVRFYNDLGAIERVISAARA
jgi:release factor glutamine methyltransferase